MNFQSAWAALLSGHLQPNVMSFGHVNTDPGFWESRFLHAHALLQPIQDFMLLS